MKRRAVLIAVSLAVAGAPALAADSLEYPVKAAYLYKFGPFVEWPPAAFDAPTAPVVVCVVGHDPFGAVLDRAVEGQHVGARPVVAKRVEKLGADSGCHIAYLGGSAAQTVAQALAEAAGPVLTVTDGGRPGAGRGVIHFVVKDNRVRFHIDDAAAARVGLNISSKLLSLALSVRSRKEGGR